jgi:predicted aspartyl protease
MIFMGESISKFISWSWHPRVLRAAMLQCCVLWSMSVLAGVGSVAAHHADKCIKSHAIAFPQAVVQNVNTIYIPFTLVGQLIAVQARVDTMEGTFLFDTGAERLILNKNHFSEDLGGADQLVAGTTGRVQSVTRRSIDSLFISQLFVLDVQAHIADLTHLEERKHTRILGILGYYVYRDFEVFIDFPNRRIMLSRVDRQGARIDTISTWEVPADSVSFIQRGHVIIVPFSINGVSLQMMLDSGAELNLLDRRVRRKVLDNFTILKRVNLVGMGAKEVEVLAGTMSDVSCGGQHAKSMNTMLTSLDEINGSFGVSVHGVVGYEFIKDRRMMINYAKSKLYFFNPWRP